MKAIIWTAYGPPEVLVPSEMAKPVPRDDQVMIKVKTSTVTAGDCELRRFKIARWIWIPVRLFMGIFKPRIKVLGQEFSGEIAAVGSEVDNFKVGDRVFLSGGMNLGGYSEYRCLSAKKIIGRIPTGVSFEEAATIPTGGINGIHFLRKGKVKKGDRVLINGAGGSIGTYALQLAKLYGAHVTCVDSPDKLEMLTEIGADAVIDYQKEDFTKNGNSYNVIIDVVGKSHFGRSLKVLENNGYYVLGNPSFRGMLRAVWTTNISQILKAQKNVVFELARENEVDFKYLSELIKEQKIKVVIDKRYSLNNIVEAHHYVEDGLKAGNVIIEVS